MRETPEATLQSDLFNTHTISEFIPPEPMALDSLKDTQGAIDILKLLRQHAEANPEFPWLILDMSPSDPEVATLADLLLCRTIRVIAVTEKTKGRSVLFTRSV